MTRLELSIAALSTLATIVSTSFKIKGAETHFDRLIKEISSCKEYRQLRACEMQLERFADKFRKDENYSNYYKCLVNAIKEQSVLLQMGRLAT